MLGLIFALPFILLLIVFALSNAAPCRSGCGRPTCRWMCRCRWPCWGQGRCSSCSGPSWSASARSASAAAHAGRKAGCSVLEREVETLRRHVRCPARRCAHRGVPSRADRPACEQRWPDRRSRSAASPRRRPTRRRGRPTTSASCSSRRLPASSPRTRRALGHPARSAAVRLVRRSDRRAVAETLDAVALDVLQVVASPARAAELRARFGRAGVARGGHPRRRGPARGHGRRGRAAAGRQGPAGATRPGGNAVASTGRCCGLAGARAVAAGRRPHPGTVAAAIAHTAAPAVDVSSGVESAPGRKDPALIEAFIRAARESVHA